MLRVTFFQPRDNQTSLLAFLFLIRHIVNHQTVYVVCFELLQHEIYVMWLVVTGTHHLILRPEIRKEIPRHYCGFRSSTQLMQSIAQSNPFWLVGCVKPENSIIKTGFNDFDLQILISRGISAQLLYEGMSTQYQGAFVLWIHYNYFPSILAV